MGHPLENIMKVYKALYFFEEIEGAEMKEKQLYLTIDESRFVFMLDERKDGGWIMSISANDNEFATTLNSNTLEGLLSGELVNATKELLWAVRYDNYEEGSTESYYWIVDSDSYHPLSPKFLSTYDQYWHLVDTADAILEQSMYSQREYDIFIENGVLDIFKPVMIDMPSTAEKMEVVNEGGLYEGEEL